MKLSQLQVYVDPSGRKEQIGEERDAGVKAALRRVREGRVAQDDFQQSHKTQCPWKGSLPHLRAITVLVRKAMELHEACASSPDPHACQKCCKPDAATQHTTPTNSVTFKQQAS